MASDPPFPDPVRKATVEECRRAVLLGEFYGRDDEMAFYRYQGLMYVIPANRPVTSGEP